MKKTKSFICVLTALLMLLAVLPVSSSARAVPEDKYLVAYYMGKSEAMTVIGDKYFSAFGNSVYDSEGNFYQKLPDGEIFMSLRGSAGISVREDMTMGVYFFHDKILDLTEEYDFESGELVIPYADDYTTAIYVSDDGFKTDVLDSMGFKQNTFDGLGLYIGEGLTALAEDENDTTADIVKIDGTVVGEDFEDISFFCDGLSAVLKDGKYGFIDASGNFAIECKYSYVTDFVNGYAFIEDDGAGRIVDVSGAKVFDVPYSVVTLDCDGSLFIITSLSDSDEEMYDYHLFDKTGKEVAKDKYGELLGGKLAVLYNEKSGKIYNENGEVVLNNVVDASVDEENGIMIALLEGNSVYGIYDLSGNKIGELPDTDYYEALSGVFAKYDSSFENVGLITADGREIVPCKYESIVEYSAFENGNHVCVFEDEGEYYTYFLTYSDTPFNDVKASNWFYDAVTFTFDNSLLNGVSDTRFAPNEPMTRAMLVTVLWRLEDCPAPEAQNNTFTDVKDSRYFFNAVLWAAENGIAEGVSATEFAPDKNITREQIATMIYRYAKMKGEDMSASGTLSDFPDGRTVSNYASEAMQWAIGSGLMQGKKAGDDIKLEPKSNSTRAEVATVLMRYICK